MSAHLSFHTTTLTPAEDSVASFQGLINDATRRNAVHKVDLHTLISDAENQDVYNEEKGYSLDSWRECVSRIPEIPNLKEVSLKFTQKVANPEREQFFYEYRGTESKALRTGVLNTLFTALAHDHVNVNTLSFENLQDLTLGVYDTPAFHIVRGKLKGLHLKIAVEYSEHGPDRDIDIPEKHAFFNRELNAHWLEPLQTQLTHLTLYGQDYWGVYPRWHSKDLHFPNLKSLSVGRWSIAHDWQIDWILSHADTLEELYLDDCPIAHALRFEAHQHESLDWEAEELSVKDQSWATGQVYPSLRWSIVLPLFASRLKNLKRFGMSRGPWYEHDFSAGDVDQAFQRRYELPANLDVSRYCIFDCGTLPSPWIQEYHYHRPGESGAKRYDCCWAHDAEFDEGNVALKYPDERESEQRALDELIGGLKGHE